MHFPHSITIDGETYIHKERYEREQAERQRLGHEMLAGQPELMKAYMVEAIAPGTGKALAAKDAEIAALQQRLHDAIETRERVIRRLGEQLATAHNEVERLSSGSWKVEADEKIATLRGDRDLVWSALNVLGWEAVEARDGEIALLSKDGRCVHALLREAGAISPPPPGPPGPPPPSEPPLRIHGVSVGSRKP